MKTCLITGSTGLIGSYLLPRLTSDYVVYALVRSSKNKLSYHSNIKVIHADFSTDWNPSVLPKNIDVIIHLAQSEHFREFPQYAKDIFQINTISTLKLLDYAYRTKAKKFIFASSGGLSQSKNQVERNFYLTTKLCSELIADNYTAFMDIIVLRFFFVYGPGQKKTFLIPRLIEAVKSQKPIILQGKEGIKINPIYVEDAADAIVKATSLKGNYQINIAGPQMINLREIGEIIGKQLGIKPKFKIRTKERVQNLIGSIEKMIRLLGVSPLSFKEGMSRYFKENRL